MDPDPAIFQTLDRTARAPYPRAWYLRRLAWNVVQSTLFSLPLPRGYAWRRFLLRLFGAKIGRACAFVRSVRIFHPWLLEVGEYSAFSTNVTLYNLGPLHVGRHTVLSQDVYVCGGTHDYTRPDLPLIRPKNMIGSGVWVAAGAFVGPGVSIGDNSVIAARAVVVADIPAGVVAGGNPAQVIKPRPMGAGPAGDPADHSPTAGTVAPSPDDLNQR